MDPRAHRRAHCKNGNTRVLDVGPRRGAGVLRPQQGRVAWMEMTLLWENRPAVAPRAVARRPDRELSDRIRRGYPARCSTVRGAAHTDRGTVQAACRSRGQVPSFSRRRCVMPNPDTLLDSLERFAGALTSGYGIGDVLHNLTEEMAEVLDITGAGVTLVHDGQQRFVTAAIDAIATLERVQEHWQKGPCVDAVATARPVMVPDMAAGDASKRWPDYTVAAKTGGSRP